MAVQFDITATDKFFLGEDKIIEYTIFGQDGVTPLDISGLPLEWNMRKMDSAADPPILVKGIGTGLNIVGIYDVNPTTNTQRLQTVFVPADTTGLKPNFPYRHSLKRKDLGNAGIFSYGSITFLQATER